MFGHKKLEEIDALINRLHGQMENFDSSQKKVEVKMDKYSAYLNGIAKGTMNEKFEVMKTEMRDFLLSEIATAVDAKVMATMAALLTSPEKVQLKPVTSVAPPAAPIVSVISQEIQNIGKQVTVLSKQMDDLKTNRQKDHQAYSERLTTLETNLNKSNEIIEKFTQFFEKFDGDKLI